MQNTEEVEVQKSDFLENPQLRTDQHNCFIYL